MLTHFSFKRVNWSLAAAVIVILFTAAPFARTQTLSVRYTFKGGDGAFPYGRLVFDSNGNLYGTTLSGGNNYGVVFEITPTGKEKVLHTFEGGKDGAAPWSGLVRDGEGNLYGTAPNGGSYGAGVVFEVTKNNKEKLLYTFTGKADGSGPVGSLVRDSKGNLYGTTAGGGTDGQGTVFKLTPAGTETTLHTFTGGDGAFPYAGLVMDSTGNLYGTTYLGGAFGQGAVFVLGPDGEKVLYSFAGSPDGARPEATLLRDAKGNLFGTTFGGGATDCQPFGCGTVFEVTPTGAEKVLHAFSGGADGSNPYARLVRDGKNNLFGTTFGGGSFSSGTVFEVTNNGEERVLYAFTGGNDGGAPFGGLVWDKLGNLYGTTVGGGAYDDGTLFKLDPSKFVNRYGCESPTRAQSRMNTSDNAYADEWGAVEFIPYPYNPLNALRPQIDHP